MEQPDAASREITALYRSRAEADAAARQLALVGLDPASVRIEADAAHVGTSSSPGLFDKLAGLLLPDQTPVRLSADVPAHLMDQAGAALHLGSNAAFEPGSFEPRSFLFRETAERLLVEKEVVIREELVVTRQGDTRVRRIDDAVRRTEVEVERFDPEGIHAQA